MRVVTLQSPRNAPLDGIITSAQAVPVNPMRILVVRDKVCFIIRDPVLILTALEKSVQYVKA